MTCCFFGHKDAPSSICDELEEAIRELIVKDKVSSFLFGNQGRFDAMVLTVIRKLKEIHPHITYSVVLAYMPGSKEEYSVFDPTETLYPEGLESVHPRYAISWRNRWMVSVSDVVITYITHSWGGAMQYAELAKRKKKRVINIATLMTQNKTDRGP